MTISALGSLAAAPLKKGTSSLRLRQLGSMLILVALGISLLGGGYFSFYQSERKADLQSKQSNIAQEILFSGPLFSDELVRTHEDIDNLRKLLKLHNFSEGNRDTGTDKEQYAYFLDPKTNYIIWQSKYPGEVFDPAYPNRLNNHVIEFPLTDIVVSGEESFKEITVNITADGTQVLQPYMVYSKRIKAEGGSEMWLVLAKSASSFIDEGIHVQNNIIALFFSTLALVLVAQLISNYFFINPIKDFEAEVKQIEAGAQDAILKSYPVELTEVKSAINILINAEKGQKRRYRESLDNLAHSLKAPLSEALSAQAKYEIKGSNQEDLKKPLNQMCDIVAYQLKLAAVRTSNAVIREQALRPVIHRLRDSLHKVYSDKSFEIRINVEEMDAVILDRDDLIELFGNLMSNACRFCENFVEVTARRETNFLIVDIDDDGVGFQGNGPTKLLYRGMRSDSKKESQGIGLAISNEIVEAAGGGIELKVSPQAGARVRLSLPHSPSVHAEAKSKKKRMTVNNDNHHIQSNAEEIRSKLKISGDKEWNDVLTMSEEKMDNYLIAAGSNPDDAVSNLRSRCKEYSSKGSFD